jgi:hypothetical protein
MFAEGKCLLTTHHPGLLLLKLLGFFGLLSQGLMRFQLARVPPNPLSLVVLRSSLLSEIPRRLDQFSLGFISLGDLCLIDWVLRLVFKIQMGFQIAYSVNGPPLMVGWLAQLLRSPILFPEL